PELEQSTRVERSGVGVFAHVQLRQRDRGLGRNAGLRIVELTVAERAHATDEPRPLLARHPRGEGAVLVRIRLRRSPLPYERAATREIAVADAPGGLGVDRPRVSAVEAVEIPPQERVGRADRGGFAITGERQVGLMAG